MFSIGYDSSFSKSVQLEEGVGDNQNILESCPITTLDNIEALVNTNEYYKKWGWEETSKNLGSQNVSNKSTSTKIKPRNNRK